MYYVLFVDAEDYESRVIQHNAKQSDPYADSGFDLAFPSSCDGVPSELLNPRNTWSDKDLYDQTANGLAAKFVKNFEKFTEGTSSDILDASPKVLAN